MAALLEAAFAPCHRNRRPDRVALGKARNFPQIPDARMYSLDWAPMAADRDPPQGGRLQLHRIGETFIATPNRCTNDRENAD